MKKVVLVVLALLLSIPAILIAVCSFYIRGGDEMGKWFVQLVKDKYKLKSDA